MSIFVALFKIKLLLYFNVNNIYMKYFNKKNEKKMLSGMWYQDMLLKNPGTLSFNGGWVIVTL